MTARTVYGQKEKNEHINLGQRKHSQWIIALLFLLALLSLGAFVLLCLLLQQAP